MLTETPVLQEEAGLVRAHHPAGLEHHTRGQEAARVPPACVCTRVHRGLAVWVWWP